MINKRKKMINWKKNNMKINKHKLFKTELITGLLNDSLLLIYLANLLQSYYVINWRKYNHSLVKRGEIMLGFDIIDSWDNELK